MEREVKKRKARMSNQDDFEQMIKMKTMMIELSSSTPAGGSMDA